MLEEEKEIPVIEKPVKYFFLAGCLRFQGGKPFDRRYALVGHNGGENAGLTAEIPVGLVAEHGGHHYIKKQKGDACRY